MGRMVTLPNGAQMDWDMIPNYSPKHGMTGKFCPFTDVPLERATLARFTPQDRARYLADVEFMEKQLALDWNADGGDGDDRSVVPVLDFSGDSTPHR